jgi:hypothetical protein
MSGRIYDPFGSGGKIPFCSKCNSIMFTSQETNFNGIKCKNKKCNGDLLDSVYFKSEEAHKVYLVRKRFNQNK